ncbi:MAG TPA: fasciclin domain-containing protein [Acidimicrobiia bacterium]|nr:fasciclin domain-containing protein [Acidimicrobiia bacterium]
MKNRTIALVAVIALALAACGGESDETTTTEAAAATSTTEDMTTTTEEMMEGDTIVDIAAGNEDFSTLVAAVEAAGLTDALADPDATLTVFAPTNDAFAAALEALGLTAEELLADTETLTAILTYHVLGEVVTSSDIAAAGAEEIPLETLSGEELVVTVGDDGTVGFDGQTAVVTMADLEASNGVIHVIDAVLLPPSMSS